MSVPIIYLLLAALVLVIPLAVIAGQRRPAGPIVVSGGGALAAFAGFWLFLGGAWSFRGLGSPSLLVSALVFFGGMLLFVAAWALALAAAAGERHWRWLAVLALAGYLSAVAVIFIAAPTDPCLFGPPPGVDAESVGFTCIATNPLGQLLVLVAYFAGPAPLPSSSACAPTFRACAPKLPSSRCQHPSKTPGLSCTASGSRRPGRPPSDSLREYMRRLPCTMQPCWCGPAQPLRAAAEDGGNPP